MKSLQYTTMCIREAMRLYPPVPYFFKELSEDINVQGCLIPKGIVASFDVSSNKNLCNVSMIRDSEIIIPN